MSSSSESSIAALLRQSLEANTLLMQGDAERYHATVSYTHLTLPTNREV